MPPASSARFSRRPPVIPMAPRDGRAKVHAARGQHLGARSAPLRRHLLTIALEREIEQSEEAARHRLGFLGELDERRRQTDVE